MFKHSECLPMTELKMCLTLDLCQAKEHGIVFNFLLKLLAWTLCSKQLL